jgi:L-ascorbate metabolism protein UlaG (beta-lactamase superfamily)
MRLTKHAHACVSIEHDGARLLIDPGTFAADAGGLLAHASAVLITHDHFDHLDLDAVSTAMATRSDLAVYGPASAIAALRECGADAERLRTVRDGDRFEVGGVSVLATGSAHASIHDSITVPENVGYVIADAIYHPGDSYHLPETRIETLLVPASGPWTHMGQAIDFVRAVAPRRSVPIHDIMLSEVGHRSVGMFLGEDGPAGVPLHQLTPAEAIEL